jgi:putative addiction module component (TIGR02574 family)
MTNDFSYLFQLSTADKLQLVEDLWDDIAADDEPVPVPQWQIDELRRRKTLHQDGDNWGSTWEDVQQRIQERRLNE